MPIIEHKFSNHQINPKTSILIIGTFNPNVDNNIVSFFYGRPRNFLWRYLPFSFFENDLKEEELNVKLEFMNRRKVDFIDLIKSVDVEVGQELNFDDNYIDERVNEWNDIEELIKNLPSLSKVIFTRSTFNGIPNIFEKVNDLELLCLNNKINFIRIISPARFWRQDRQLLWNNFINN